MKQSVKQQMRRQDEAKDEAEESDIPDKAKFKRS